MLKKLRSTLYSLLALSAFTLSITTAGAAEATTPDPVMTAKWQQLDNILKGASDFVKAGKGAKWEEFVKEDANTAWAVITDLKSANEDTLTAKLNALSAEENSAIYANVWSNADALTPWLTHNIWVLIAAALVFIMHLGFSALESGLCRKKNTVNILFKNVWIISTGLLVYFLWGFNAHYPGAFNNFIAMGSSAEYPANELLVHATNLYHNSYTFWTDFIFQAMFAATAATIVSGAVAERVKLGSFMIYAVILVAFAYPIAGSWHWGGGFLNQLDVPFYDFAGSTVVHAFGAAAALAAVIILGPRKGKFTKNGVKPILPHSTPLAAIGVFLLFLGWFGFNGGSVLAAEPHLVSLVFTTTALSAAAGGVASIAASWIVLKKPDVSMALNGLLAGLVGITAGADVISPTMSIVTGAISGLLVVFAIVALDKIKIDDPVGAIAVHGVCGIWGTLAVAVFADASFVSQLIGIAAVCAFAFAFSFITFYILKLTLGVRVDEKEEVEGLDVAEHGSPAYSDY